MSDQFSHSSVCSAPGGRADDTLELWSTVFLFEVIATNQHDEHQSTLDYATPNADVKDASDRQFAAITFAILAGLLAVPFLFYGVDAIVWLVDSWHHADGEDVVSVMVCMLIGVIAAAFSIRWIASTRKRRRVPANEQTARP